MFEVNPSRHIDGLNAAGPHPVSGQSAMVQRAMQRFQWARDRARLVRLREALTRRSERLLDLQEMEPQLTVLGRAYAGIRTVEIDDIRGSEGRCEDFDVHFYPRKDHNRSRWIGIYLARQQDVPLPAVKLIEICDTYFVRDGHHRISVARLAGQKSIEADVIVWRVAPPAPWQLPQQPQAAGRL